ncbi:MAG: glycosyltransferase family 4 protein [Pseudomonadota bacterium]
MTFERTILQVIPNLRAGGAERTCVEIASAVVAAGGRALVVSEGGRLEAAVRAAGGETLRAPVASKNPFTIWRNAAHIADLVREHDVDIIHVRSRAPAWSALWAARRTGVPMVATWHGAYRARTALKRFYNSAMARGALVIANSTFTARAVRRFQKRTGVKKARLKTIPRGADIGAFDPTSVAASRVKALAEAWGLPDPAVEPEEERPIRLLLPARMTAWKGHADAIKALSILIAPDADSARDASAPDEARPRLQLILCGDTHGREDYAAALQLEARRHGVHEHTHIVGNCADMAAAYTIADIVLAPSRRPEAFGRTAAEAGAMGKPIVASDHGGAREVVADGRTGRLTSPGDPAALAAAIADLVAIGPSGRAVMGAAARRRVQSKFSIDAMCAATLDAYEAILRIVSNNRDPKDGSATPPPPPDAGSPPRDRGDRPTTTAIKKKRRTVKSADAETAQMRRDEDAEAPA